MDWESRALGNYCYFMWLKNWRASKYKYLSDAPWVRLCVCMWQRKRESILKRLQASWHVQMICRKNPLPKWKEIIPRAISDAVEPLSATMRRCTRGVYPNAYFVFSEILTADTAFRCGIWNKFQKETEASMPPARSKRKSFGKKISKHDGRRTAKSTDITQKESQLSYIHTHTLSLTHTHTHRGPLWYVSYFLRTSVFYNLHLALWSNNHTWPWEQKSCIQLRLMCPWHDCRIQTIGHRALSLTIIFTFSITVIIWKENCTHGCKWYLLQQKLLHFLCTLPSFLITDQRN